MGNEMSNPITRRGFIGVLGAFVAAASTSRAMPQGFAKAKPIKEQVGLMAMLRQCRVESLYEECQIASYRRIVVKYRHAPNEPRTAMDDHASRKCAGLLPVGVMVTQQCDMIDVTSIGNQCRIEVESAVHYIEVTFA
jgi:hypothetical protein